MIYFEKDKCFSQLPDSVEVSMEKLPRWGHDHLDSTPVLLLTSSTIMGKMPNPCGLLYFYLQNENHIVILMR